MKQFYFAIKRIQDIILSVFSLILLLPLIAVTAIAIYVDDPSGSPFFFQNRVGKDGKLFKMYKFRSMCVDAEDRLQELYNYNEMSGPVFKIEDDPRATRVGRVIRKCCIDELPQLWNVLRGDMSLVGPRPPLMKEVESYTAYQRQRLSVIPGMTCYWQVQPYRNRISFEEWVEWDLKYIKEQSFLTDWKIILQTLKIVLLCWGK